MINMRRIVSIDALCNYLGSHKQATQLPLDCPNLRTLNEDIELVYKGSRVYKKGTLVCYDSLHNESQDVSCKLGSLRVEDHLLVTECISGRHFTLLNIKGYLG